MANRIALVVENGRFEVRVTDEWGGQIIVGQSSDLQQCLEHAYMRLGHPLVIPISGPNTAL
jgi:hypothetical protein